jgi:alpha-beta hydrolase superfamily lysophospholipase
MRARLTTTDRVPAVLVSPPRGATQASHARARIWQWCIVAFAVVSVLAGCGGSHPATTASTSPGPFPSTPAGAQARWLLEAAASLPISNAAARAHFSQAYLAHNPPAALNGELALMQPLRLVSVKRSQPNSLVFVATVRGAQPFQITVAVDARGLIARPLIQALVPTAAPASVIPPLAAGWDAQPVSFEAGGVKVYGTYTHPSVAAAGVIPGVLLLGGSGTVTDRNDNSPQQPNRNLLEAVANWLSADGVATLRYDKLGSGQTGWGRYAGHLERVELKVYEQESTAALSFLARQRQIDRARLAVFGHSQGGVYALLLATGLAGQAPRLHAVGLLEPLPDRQLNVVMQAVRTSPLKLRRAFARAVTSLRRTGTLPSGLPAAVVQTFTPSGWGTYLEVSQLDRYDPAVVAAKLAPQTPVLLTCSNVDNKFDCADENRLAAGLAKAHAKLAYLHLDRVNHFLKEDITGNPAGYNQALPFSNQLRSELQRFLSSGP